MPSGFVVVIAWLSMFIPTSVIPARVSMIMMTFVAFMAMFTGVRQEIPKVNISVLLHLIFYQVNF